MQKATLFISLTNSKKKYGIENVVLHLADIKRSQKKFSFLSPGDLKTEFYVNLANLLNITDFQIIGVVIDKQYLHNKYGEFASEPYHYATKMLIEAFVTFLQDNDGIGKVCVESRNNPKLDLPLDTYFRNIYENGTRYGGVKGSGNIILSSKQVQGKLSSKNIKFINKQTLLMQKVNGLEIADLLCNPVMQIIKETISTYNRDKNRPLFELRQCPSFEKEIIHNGIIKPRKYRFIWQP